MAVNGIRVSALPEMIASDLTNDDYLIVNDANTNTRRINYEEFLKSVNTDISDLDVVQSVNGLSGVVSLDAADVGAPSLVQFQALETTSNAAGALAAANASAIITLNTNTSDNTADIDQLRIDVDLKADNVPTLNSQNYLKQGDTVPQICDKLDAGIVTRAADKPVVGSAYTQKQGDTQAQINDKFDNAIQEVRVSSNSNTAGASAGATALQQADADLLYAPIVTSGNTVDGNATDIATNATAIEDVQADVDANEVASVDADDALSGRLDTLEADPTTATEVTNAVNAVDVKADANEALLAALRGLNVTAGAYTVDTLVTAIVAAVTPTP